MEDHHLFKVSGLFPCEHSTVYMQSSMHNVGIKEDNARRHSDLTHSCHSDLTLSILLCSPTLLFLSVSGSSYSSLVHPGNSFSTSSSWRFEHSGAHLFYGSISRPTSNHEKACAKVYVSSLYNVKRVISYAWHVYELLTTGNLESCSGSR